MYRGGNKRVGFTSRHTSSKHGPGVADCGTGPSWLSWVTTCVHRDMHMRMHACHAEAETDTDG